MLNQHLATALLAMALALPLSLSGCGEDAAGAYRNEMLIIETPVASKTTKEKSENEEEAELQLVAEDASHFNLVRFGAYIPWVPYPLFDYYLEPIPLAIPVSWGYAVVDFVHPFYGPAVFGPWGDDDEF